MFFISDNHVYFCMHFSQYIPINQAHNELNSSYLSLFSNSFHKNRRSNAKITIRFLLSEDWRMKAFFQRERERMSERTSSMNKVLFPYEKKNTFSNRKMSFFSSINEDFNETISFVVASDKELLQQNNHKLSTENVLSGLYQQELKLIVLIKFIFINFCSFFSKSILKLIEWRKKIIHSVSSIHKSFSIENHWYLFVAATVSKYQTSTMFQYST